MLKDKQKKTFNTSEEMFEYISKGRDLYNLETGTYVFQYNEVGSFATYMLSKEEAEVLEQKSSEHDDYWSGYLGVGGCIYDDPSSEFYRHGNESNRDFCNKMYDKGSWIDVTH